MTARFALAILLAMWGTHAPAQSVANGQQLYAGTCNVCHGTPPAGGPETAANQPAVIRNAMNTIGPMQFLRGMFSDAQLADIAAYLASLQGSGGGGPAPPPVPAFDYTDLWWIPAESGWGFNIIQHPSNLIFAVIYTYQVPNRPMWFVLPRCDFTSPTTCTGGLYRVTGSPPDRAFAPGEVFQVGNATLLFNGANNAMLTYSVDNVQVTKAIERQPF